MVYDGILIIKGRRGDIITNYSKAVGCSSQSSLLIRGCSTNVGVEG